MAEEQHPSQNGSKTFRLFLKGGDIAASLNGLMKEWAAAKQANGTAVQITREPGYPAAILLQQLDGITLPEELAEQGLNDEQITGQFQSKLFNQPADMVALSLLPDVTAETWQRRETGYRLSPPAYWRQRWSAEQRQWFERHFVRLDRSTADQVREDFGRLAQALQDGKDSQIVLYGVSSYDPADSVHNYHASDETNTLRAHRFNHALIQLSQELGVIVLDVDRLVAEVSARDHVKQAFTYSPEANKAIGQELLRIIEDLGYFDEHPLLKFVLPQFDLQVQSGSLVKWHVREGKWVNEGDNLCDFRVEEIKRLKRVNTDNPDEIDAVGVNSKNWSWLVRVTAVDNGFFRKKVVSEKESCSVGDLLAVFSVRDNERVQVDEETIANAPTFRVVSNVLETAEQDVSEK